MKIVRESTGVELDVSGDVQVVEARGARTLRSRGPRLPTGPVPLAAARQADPLLDALSKQRMAVLDTFELVSDAAARTRGAAHMPASARAAVEIDADENAVILLEQDGLYRWVLPTRVGPGFAARRGPQCARPRKRIEFDLAAAPAASPSGRRGALTDLLVGEIKTYILKFVAKVVGHLTIKALERNVPEGLVLMRGGPEGWRRVETARDLGLPADRPARILLFVHGTFSSTVGSFGALGATTWGKELLTAAEGAYDAVIGFDHRTLGSDPLENANDLLGRLEAFSWVHPPVIDAVAFSRGVLVLRSLVETLLPSSAGSLRVRRAIFVAGTNAGTPLADPQRWETLVDLATNLASIGAKTLALIAPAAPATLILEEAVCSLGAFVKYLASVALDARVAPGLAAMTAGGAFVTTLNQLQPGQPGPADSWYCVVSSDFDVSLLLKGPESHALPRRLALWLLDTLADVFNRSPNDLVVGTDSALAIDPDHGIFVKDRLVLASNAQVHHTVYFTRPEVVTALGRWLGLEPAVRPPGRGPEVLIRGGAAQWSPLLPAMAETNVLTFAPDAGVDEVRAAIEAAAAKYVVVRRAPDMLYAYAANIISELAAKKAVRGLVLGRALATSPALELHENRRSSQVQLGQPLPAITGAPAAPTVGRIVLLEGNEPRAVVETGPVAGGVADLRRRMAVPPAAAAPPRKSRGQRGQPPAAGGPPPPQAVAAPRRGARPPVPVPARCYMNAQMPDALAVGSIEQVLVTVSLDELAPLSGSAAANASAKVDLTREIVVNVVARSNLRLVGETRVAVDLTGPARSATLAFDVEATDVGPGELCVLLRQGAQVMATITLRPTIATGAPVKTGQVRAAADVVPPEPEPTLYPTLQIIEVDRGGKTSYQFLLEMEDGAFTNAESLALKTSPQVYVDGIYDKIEKAWLGSNEAVDEFTKSLREHGADLFDDLVPPAIQTSLWNARDRIKAIRVYSTEPFIPWELVHLKPPQQPGQTPSRLPAESHFLAEKGLVRWLHGVGAPANQIHAKSAYHIVPDYPPQWALPEAQDEIPFLEKEVHAKAYTPTVKKVRELLDGGTFGLLHFSGHGEADSSGSAKIMLAGSVVGGSYVPEYLEARTVAHSAGLTARRPAVVLNACQIGRAGWKLTSIGGFAAAFLGAGAGVFVGTLWSVGDAPARRFTEGFYSALKKKKTLSEAALLARKAARGDATWLAYVVYGAPSARIVLP